MQEDIKARETIVRLQQEQLRQNQLLDELARKKLLEQRRNQEQILENERRTAFIRERQREQEMAEYIKQKNKEWEQIALKDLEIDLDLFIYGLKEMAFTSLELTGKEGEKINEQ